MPYAPDQKILYCMKLVESMMIENPVLTNNLCYPRIGKKVMFLESSDQNLVANIITRLSDGYTL